MTAQNQDARSGRATTAASVRWCGLTDTGRFRANNEDAFLALAVDGNEIHYLGKSGTQSLARTDCIFSVSDGMGGAQSGEFASQIARDRITRLLPRAFRLSASGISAGFGDILAELFSSIHADLQRLGQAYEECAGMGTTLTLCWFTPEWMYFGHIGDSRLYYLPRAGGPMVQVTHDHTHVGWMRRQGRLNEREAREHPRRNALQQALGAGQQFIETQVGAIAHQPGDRFLICSDGLVEGLWDRNIEEHMRAGPDAMSDDKARLMVEESVRISGRDNTTAIAIEVDAPSSAAGTAVAES